jgi:hypothetical protein
MPIPAAPEGRDETAAVVALFRQVHDELRGQLAGLDDDAVNWAPTAGANSIATIVTHVVGSEAETLLCVAGRPCVRDRDAEFVGQARTAREVLALLDAADDQLRAAEPQIDAERLQAVFPLPTLPAEEVRTGLTWLLGNYGHAREHLGQIELTRQLYESERERPSAP